ncbi:MAG: hypothetical protein IJP75_10930 [Bacteroidaceae bacterium]|nr:hypothetical protein [Bacteroidaceae bacterium]
MKKMIITAIVALLNFASLPVVAQVSTLNVGGTNRTYIAYAPKNLEENRPLFIYCHGSGQDANYMLNTQFRDTQNPERKISIENVCDTAKFVIVFPNGISNQWDISGDRDINFVKALIDEMVKKYKIDTNRVYLGGFSMGGMFTYHAMNKIPDLIAAFVPCSGYPMGGATANANVRALPILHIHGTGDDVCVFSGAQPALNVWINHNGCPTTAKVVNNYNGFNAKMHTWAPGNDGVEVKLLELANKGHWVCKEPAVYTGKEMWNFCKNYSLNKTSPNVSITAPKAGLVYTCFAPTGEATFPSVKITATASDPNGNIEKVEFYDGSTLIATCTGKPYTATLVDAKAGKHKLKAVATDNDGETSTATVEVTFSAPASNYTFSSFFTENASIPAGWTTYDGDEKRTGYSNGYFSGCRILQFTGSRHAFSYGLYFRNKEGKTRSGYAKYGLSGTNATLKLAPGSYQLKYKICNWNQPNFTPVTLCIEKRNGQEVASQTYTPTVNIGNVASNDFGSVAQKNFDFDIEEEGEYVVAIYSADSGWSDAVIGYLSLYTKGYTATGISTLSTDVRKQGKWFTLSGQQVERPTHGFYVHDGKKVYIK